jgi:ammonium transporter Rh
LHGMPGVLAGIVGALVALFASRERYGGNRLYTFYPARTPSINSTDFSQFNLKDTIFYEGGDGRSASSQAWYQLAAIGVTLIIAIVGGVITGFVMKLPIFEQINDEEEMFDDEPAWITPDDYSLKLTEVRVQREEEDRAVSSA